MTIRVATHSDYDQVWEIFQYVIKTGDTYVFDPNTKKEDLAKLWFASYMKTYVAVENENIIGTYILKQNQIDLGSHVANCGYMVHPNAQGKGIGEAMCNHSLKMAKELGFESMQFNMVVSTNEGAIRLWKKLGFDIVGTVPEAFKHRTKGFVDAYIMFRKL
jgi:L-amino acid N-acyltransferase YncA